MSRNALGLGQRCHAIGIPRPLRPRPPDSRTAAGQNRPRRHAMHHPLNGRLPTSQDRSQRLASRRRRADSAMGDRVVLRVAAWHDQPSIIDKLLDARYERLRADDQAVDRLAEWRFDSPVHARGGELTISMSSFFLAPTEFTQHAVIGHPMGWATSWESRAWSGLTGRPLPDIMAYCG